MCSTLMFGTLKLGLIDLQSAPHKNITSFAFKVENNYDPKSWFYFFQNFAGNLFGGDNFSPALKPDFERSRGPLTSIPFPDGVMGNNF